MDTTDFKEQNFSLLGKDSSFEGNLHLHGDAVISSEIKGNINMASEGLLTLERSSKVEGQIECFDLEIFGIVEGEIKAKGSLTIRPSANIKGKIFAQTMKIYPGATVNFEGHTAD